MLTCCFRSASLSEVRWDDEPGRDDVDRCDEDDDGRDEVAADGGGSPSPSTGRVLSAAVPAVGCQKTSLPEEERPATE